MLLQVNCYIGNINYIGNMFEAKLPFKQLLLYYNIIKVVLVFGFIQCLGFKDILFRTEKDAGCYKKKKKA